MPTYIFECKHGHGRREVVRRMAEASDPAYCPTCLRAWAQTGPGEELGDFAAHSGPMRRIYTAPLKQIIRPSGWRLSPDDPKFGDFRREMELGELKDDPTPVRMSQAEIDAFDNPPVTIEADPERDRQLHQIVRANWTNDLSPGVAYNRELAAKAALEEATA